jgi:hypothetical protein
MRNIALPTTAILATILALLLPTAPAQALSTKTWVANGGSGSTCSRASPCGTFQAAHDATAAGGEINCVDAGDYGTVTINKAISIICDNTEAGILAANGNVAVIITAGANDVITLRGLDINGAGSGGFGIDFQTGGALHVDKVQIRNFRATNADVSGIFFNPLGYAELTVTDSIITDNGNAGQAFNGGIVVLPIVSGSSNVSINRVRLVNNSTGISGNGSLSTGVAVNVVVTDSLVTSSATNGIAAFSTGTNAGVSILVDHSVVTGNFSSGINANGATASGAGSAAVRIGDSTIALNLTGVSTTNAGVVQSFKNNRISGNLTDGTPIPAFPGPGGTPLQ